MKKATVLAPPAKKNIPEEITTGFESLPFDSMVHTFKVLRNIYQAKLKEQEALIDKLNKALKDAHE